MLATGAPAPPITLTDQDEHQVSLPGPDRRWIVLWWYPQASSGTCTVQGRGFRPLTAHFKAAGADVYGVSFNTAEENKEFASCESFDFPLLSDPSMAAGRAYGVVRDPDEPFADKPRRITYLIDPNQVIRRVYVVDDAESHAAQVLADLRELQAVR